MRYRFAQLQNGGFGCLVCGLFCGPLHVTSVNSLIYNWLLAEQLSAACAAPVPITRASRLAVVKIGRGKVIISFLPF